MFFSTLEKMHPDQLLPTFNAAFAQYFTTVQLTPAQLERKMRSEHTCLSFSVGCFDGDDLVGFILHALRKEDGLIKIYNGGTGVLPEYRGQHITTRMYAFIEPMLRAGGVHQCTLEVITANEPAIRSYEQAGFRKTRGLSAFKGMLKHCPASFEGVIEEVADPDWALLSGFCDWEPSWQNAVASIRELNDSNTTLVAYLDGRPAGFLNYNFLNHRMTQCAVEPSSRRKGIATALFNHLAAQYDQPFSVINVASDDLAAVSFLENRGMAHLLDQYEMCWLL